MSTNTIDPIADAEVVETELLLADLESLEKRVPNLVKRGQQGDKESKIAASVLGQALELLREGKPARLTKPKDEEEARLFAQAQLITAKPVLYVCNVNEDDAAERQCRQRARCSTRPRPRAPMRSSFRPRSRASLSPWTWTSASPSSRKWGFTKPASRGSSARATTCLHLITFFTVGPKEARAWTVEKGSRAPQAAGEIHTDFERGFIRAETIAYDDYVALNGEAGARDAGKLRQEGKDYVVKDGDVLHFKFNV